MASPTTAPQLKSANTFTLVSQSSGTTITYYPDAPGPLVQGLTQGALFEYRGPEGQLSFRSAQISRQETPSGQLLSVVLKPQVDAGSLALSVFLPPVSVGPSGSESFTTYGVKTHHAGLVANAGAQITYEMECFEVDAKAQLMPR
jgi:hypothetical protein